jgi:hypothetical protein
MKSGNRRGKFYTGADFPPGGNSILTLKIGGNYMLGHFFPHGEILYRARFSGGKDYAGENLCYNTGADSAGGVYTSPSMYRTYRTNLIFVLFVIFGIAHY